MTSKLGHAVACATLAAAMAAAAVWLPGASADQPIPSQRDFVSDTFGNATRTIVTGQCVRTTLPEAGAAFKGCVETEVATAKAAAPTPTPAPAREPEVAAAPKAPEPVPAPLPPAPVAHEEPVTPPASSAVEAAAAVETQGEASGDANRDQETGAAEESPAQEAEAETEAAPIQAPEPPTEAAEAPPPAAPAPPPETGPAPPTPPAQPQPRKVRLAADTQFHFNRAQLTPSGQAELDKLIAEMSPAQIGSITIVGYTDRIGPDAYNQKLSQRRADTVKQYLVGRNVEANRMQAIGRGKSDPVTPPDACKGRKGQRLIQCLAPDRRVEVEVVGLVMPAQ